MVQTPSLLDAKGFSMLIDSHCHLDRLDLKPYEGSFACMMEQTLAAGVGHMLCVSIDLESYPAMRERVAGYPQVSVSVGVHPNEQGRRDPSPEELVQLAGDPKNVAIGETGLDYYRSQGDLEWQRRRFRNHIEAARVCGKPLIVHSRDAADDTLRILREERAAEVGGVLHCFTGDWAMARAALDLGFYISFSGIVTFDNADDLREVARKLPIDRLLIETDSPYLTPVPHRGRPNEPRFVAAVAERVAGLRGMAPEDLVASTGEGFVRLFRPALDPNDSAAPSTVSERHAIGGRS
jgi:TatD DNase family protein